MRSWDSAIVPVLPGAGTGQVRIHDTVTGALTAVGPASGEARLYACGITPYDATHLGHAFTYVSIDLLARAWRDVGLRVRFAQNVTDVDDPLLERAAKSGRDWEELAVEQVALFRDDMEALAVLPPAELTGVVESLEVVIAAIKQLKDRQAVYQVPDPTYPDWYFSVTASPHLLQGTPVSVLEAEQVFAERGGDPEREGKRHRLDCLVWRQQRPGEPAWDSWLGRGRPGWHIECSAIALAALGANFDVQAGGSDLAFPHHPMSAAEASLLTGEPFAKAFMHTGMVAYLGAKMSKSLGNLAFVSRMRAQGADPMAIRLLLLGHHYRSDWEYRPEMLTEATARLARWRLAVARPSALPAEPVLASVRAALREDLNAPAAVAAIEAWVAASAASDDADPDPNAPTLVADLANALLGIRL